MFGRRKKNEMNMADLSDTERLRRIDELERQREGITERLEELMRDVAEESGVRWLKHRRFKPGKEPNRRRKGLKRDR